MTRDQLVALLMAVLIHMDVEQGLSQSEMPVYASAALQIIQAAEKVVGEE